MLKPETVAQLGSNKKKKSAAASGPTESSTPVTVKMHFKKNVFSKKMFQ